jgi:hypothetical protein
MNPFGGGFMPFDPRARGQVPPPGQYWEGPPPPAPHPRTPFPPGPLPPRPHPVNTPPPPWPHMLPPPPHQHPPQYHQAYPPGPGMGMGMPGLSPGPFAPSPPRITSPPRGMVTPQAVQRAVDLGALIEKRDLAALAAHAAKSTGEQTMLLYPSCLPPSQWPTTSLQIVQHQNYATSCCVGARAGYTHGRPGPLIPHTHWTRGGLHDLGADTEGGPQKPTNVHPISLWPCRRGAEGGPQGGGGGGVGDDPAGAREEGHGRATEHVRRGDTRSATCSHCRPLNSKPRGYSSVCMRFCFGHGRWADA